MNTKIIILVIISIVAFSGIIYYATKSENFILKLSEYYKGISCNPGYELKDNKCVLQTDKKIIETSKGKQVICSNENQKDYCGDGVCRVIIPNGKYDCTSTLDPKPIICTPPYTQVGNECKIVVASNQKETNGIITCIDGYIDYCGNNICRKKIENGYIDCKTGSPMCIPPYNIYDDANSKCVISTGLNEVAEAGGKVMCKPGFTNCSGTCFANDRYGKYNCTTGLQDCNPGFTYDGITKQCKVMSGKTLTPSGDQVVCSSGTVDYCGNGECLEIIQNGTYVC